MKNMHVTTLDAGSYAGPAFKSAPVLPRKPLGKAYKKDGGFRHYLVKHPIANFLLQVDSFGYTYETAKAEAGRLGGIVTNLSWVTRNGCKTLPAGMTKETAVLS